MHIVLGVSGGIAAYKAPELVRRLRDAGADVRVILTPNAARFVSPLSLTAVSEHGVIVDQWGSSDSGGVDHIALARWAELPIVAPATANILAKVAHGLCDDLVSLMICASACPVVFAPAMNNRMWDNPITRENVAKLQGHGYRMIGPEPGWLACRNVGTGRMSEPAKIVEEVTGLLSADSKASAAEPSPAARNMPVRRPKARRRGNRCRRRRSGRDVPARQSNWRPVRRWKPQTSRCLRAASSPALSSTTAASRLRERRCA